MSLTDRSGSEPSGPADRQTGDESGLEQAQDDQILHHDIVEFGGKAPAEPGLSSGLRTRRPALPRCLQGISEPKRQIKAIDQDAVLLAKVECRNIVGVIEADFGTDHEHVIELVAQGNRVA